MDELTAAEPTELDLADQIALLRRVGRLADRLRAEQMRLLDAARRSGALEHDGSATAAAWLRHNSTLSPADASRHAKVARRLADLPVIADALADGTIGVTHASAVDRLANDVGIDQVAAVQSELVEAATRLRDVREFERVCVRWRHALRPDRADADDDRAYANRRLSFSPTMDGVCHLNGVFDAVGGATVAAALDAFSYPDPADTPPELRRSPGQRRGDALVEIARRALDSRAAGEKGGVRPHVNLNLHVTPNAGGGLDLRGAELDWSGPVGPAAVERLLTDCSLTRVIFAGRSQPVDVGVATRVWPAAVRRAITARDRVCRFPGCDRPPPWCDIDHVIPVTDGGPTALTNGILLCRHHHRAKRRDGWWPALRDDGAVTWTHADGRGQTDPPPAVSDLHLQRVIDACADPPDAAHRWARSSDRPAEHGRPPTPTCAGEQPARYDLGPAAAHAGRAWRHVIGLGGRPVLRRHACSRSM